MINLEIAKIFYEVSDLLEIMDVEFKPYAYQKAARFLESFDRDIADIYYKGGLKALEDLPTIGKSMAEHIAEYVITGVVKEFNDLRKKVPVKADELLRVEGVGPKKVSFLYKKLEIKDLKDLRRAAKHHSISKLKGFGLHSEEKILQGIEFLEKQKGRFLLGYILPTVDFFVEKLGNLPEVKMISPAGSVRRMQETIGDVDLVIGADNGRKKIVEYFSNIAEVEKVIGQGETKISVQTKRGFNVDLRIVDTKCFGAALQYFTGNKDHNIVVRNIAKDQGFKLNEYGLFKGEKNIARKTEQEIYKKLGMKYIEPELRTDRGEIEVAMLNDEEKIGDLPNLVKYDAIKGDLHIHSDWSDGDNTIEDMARAAKKQGYSYMAITDHSLTPINHGLDKQNFKKQWVEIDRINKKVRGIKILKGVELNILRRGVDFDDEFLSHFDIVLAGVHSNLKMNKKDMTERITSAMENNLVNVITHLTGRIINRRKPYELDMDKIFAKAKETNTFLEIDSYPDRLDLADFNVRRAVEENIKLVINTDSHSIYHLGYMNLGIGTARRGWAEKKDIANTRSLGDFLKLLKK